MRTEHYGAVIHVLAGFLVCRLLSFHVIGILGDIGGHTRGGDSVVGVVVGGIPFLVLIACSVAQLTALDVRYRGAVRVLGMTGWLFAGGILALLPYSRFGAATGLVAREKQVAFGFLHALDATIFVGLLFTVALLLLALRGRSHPDSGGRGPRR